MTGPPYEDPDEEARRSAVEARARAESLAREERARLATLGAEIGALSRQAGRGRRLLAALAGSRPWGLVAGDGLGAKRGGSDAERSAARLRRRRFRAARRERILAGGGAEELRRLGARGRRRVPAAPLRGRLPQPPSIALRGRRAGPEADLSVVLAVPARRAPWAALRLLRSRVAPAEIVVAPTGRRRRLGTALAAGAKRTGGAIVVFAADAAAARPERIERLVERLRADPGLGAVAESAVRFEWAEAAPHPVESSPHAALDGGAAPAALGGALAAVRGEPARGEAPDAGYRGSLWLTELSLAAVERGWRLAAVPPAGTSSGNAEAPPSEDVALLRRRRGPALRRGVLADLAAGGGAWCARPARVLLGPGCPAGTAAAVEALGLAHAAAAAEADVAIEVDADGRVCLDWVLAGERGLAASELTADGLAGEDAPAKLARALAAGAAAPTFCIRVGTRDWEAASYGGDAALARSLARALGERGSQALLQVDADATRPAGECLDVLLTLRGRRPGAPTPGRLNLIWLISHPEEAGTAELDRYDLVLVASRRYAERLRGSVRPPVEPLLQFTDPRLFHPAPDPTPRHRVAFVGNWRGVFRRIVWDALAAGLEPALYGRGWDLLAPRRAVGEHVPHGELHRLYSACEILLCDHWDDMRELGFVSNKVLDALACGAFVIADDNPALAEELPGGVETYTGAAELREKAERYLADPAARERVARHGRELVLARHTAERRAEQLLALVAEAARQGRCL